MDKPMAEIPGWAYIAIGAVIAGFSKFVETRSGSNLNLFIFAGVIFAVIGIGKLLLQAFSRKPGSRPEAGVQMPQQARHAQAGQWQPQTHNRQAPQQMGTQEGRQQHHITQARHQQPAHESIISCPACGVRHYSYANFCMMCGNRMARRQ